MTTQNRRSRRSKRQNVRGNGNATLVSSHRFSATADVDFPRADLTDRPPSQTLPSVVPMNIRSHLFWVQQTLYQTVSAAANVETVIGRFFTIGDLTNASAFNLFDQYGIVAITLSVACSETAGGLASSILPVVTTAIDYDGANFATMPSSTAAINEYSSALSTILIPGKSHQRFLRPCTAGASYTSSAFAGYSVERHWVDNAGPSIAWYGLQGVVNNQNSSVFTIDISITYVLVFRNIY